MNPHKYHFTKNNSTKAAYPLDSHPSEIANGFYANIPPQMTKDQFRKWSSKPVTDHAFISLAQGVNPHNRISNPDNPLHSRWGFIADYDSDSLIGRPDHEVEALVQENLLKHHAQVAPTWMCRTFSGKVRLIWEFSAQVFCPDPKVDKQFLRVLKKHTSATKLLSGYDESGDASSQYQEVGHRWSQIGEAFDPYSWFYEAINAVSFKETTDLEIPLEEVAAEMERRFPGRWIGEFNLASRGPLFWIDDGVERIGCQVAERGMICYSDRAASNFLPWRDIFGSKFVSTYQEVRIQDSVKNIYAWGDRFVLVDDARNFYTDVSRNTAELKLVQGGLSRQRPKDQSLSEVEQALLFITEHQTVSAIAPCVFETPGALTQPGGKYLINSYTKPVIQPASNGEPAKWPVLHKLLTNIFLNDAIDGLEGDAVEYFLAWLKRFYTSGYERRARQGQALIIAGDAGQGKTFIANRIVGDLIGGSSDASSYLEQISGFNSHLCEVPLWTVDDGVAAPFFSSRAEFTEAVKRTVANPYVEYHKKGAAAVKVPWGGRLALTCNKTVAALQSLPNLNDDVLDKLMVFTTSGYRHRFGNAEEMEAVLKVELPHLARFLLDWQPPSYCLGGERFGVKCWHSATLTQESGMLTPENEFQELLSLWAKNALGFEPEGPPPEDHGFTERSVYWHGTATKFAIDLGHYLPEATKTRLPNAVHCGRGLAQVARIAPAAVKRYIRDGYSTYIINLRHIQ